MSALAIDPLILNAPANRRLMAVDGYQTRPFDLIHALAWSLRNGEGSPLARLIDAYLMTWWNPVSTTAVNPSTPRIAEAVMATVEEVESVLAAGLAHHEVAPSVTTGRDGHSFRLKPEVFAAVSTWKQGEGHGFTYRLHQAPPKHEVRYPRVFDFNHAAVLASALLGSTRAWLSEPLSAVWFPAEVLAERIGVATDGLEPVLEGLRARGWEIRAERPEDGTGRIGALPSPALLDTWCAYERDALTRAGGMSPGQREQVWERDVWRPRYNRPALGEIEHGAREMDALDARPEGGGWFIYRLTEPDDDGTGPAYVGITQGTLRQRLRTHTDRRGTATTWLSNGAMQAWVAALLAQGQEPVITLLASITEPDRAYVEALEHAAVVSEIARRGGSQVLNIQHHSEATGGRCDHY